MLIFIKYLFIIKLSFFISKSRFLQKAKDFFPFFKACSQSIINHRVSTSSKFKYEDVLDVHRHYRRISTIAD